MVSIIVPAYNVERYLPATIESVISQSESGWELLLVDDGSTDSTPAICDRYAQADSRIRVLHKPNGGMSDARNSGLDRACGDFIAFIDADDVIAPDFLRLMLNVAKKSGAGMVVAPYQYFTGATPAFISGTCTGLQCDPLFFSAEAAVETALYQNNAEGTRFLMDNCVWGKLYRREMFSDIRFTPGIGYEDLDIFYRLWPLAGEIAFVPVPLTGYRQHAASYMHTFSLRRADALDVTDRMVEALSGASARLQAAARVRRFAAYYNILSLIYANRADAPELEKRCLDAIRSLRAEVLRNRNARLKDRLGALLSYAGAGMMRLMSRLRG